MVISPIIMIFLCYIFDIYGVAAIILVVFSAAPTATSGYMLAKKMGGNAEAMAVSITFQTACSLFTLPIVLFFAKKLFI
jgi:predicted permease